MPDQYLSDSDAPVGAALGAEGTALLTSSQDPEWLRRFEVKLAQLLALPEGWDSYGAPVPAPELALSVLDLIYRIATPETPEPEVVPTCVGGFQVEWHCNQVDLEIEINSPIRIGAYLCDANTGTMNDQTLKSDWQVLHNWIQRLH